MAKKVHSYESDAIRVLYDAPRCIHAGECVRGLPQVFDPQKTPWVSAGAAEIESLVEVVECCPAGALRYERLDGGEAESPATENTVAVADNGPLYARGELEIVDAAGQVLHRDTRVALCRCGASQNKPFCDNAHSAAGFQAGGEIPDPRIKGDGDTGGALRITLAPDGPLILAGPVTLHDAEGDDRCQGDKTALCRCGASQNKPFCDGAHAKIGFKT